MIKSSSPPRRGRRGFTFVELMISAGILSLVMIAVASLMSYSGRTIKDLDAITVARSARMVALDQIRFTLASAKIGTVVLSNAGGHGYHTIQFTDPTQSNATSQYTFDTSTGILTYDNDINAGPAARIVAKGAIDISFSCSNPALVQLHVSNAANVDLGEVDTQDGDTSVYLRNP